MDNPKIYVACLAAYNSGVHHGAWIDATQSLYDIYTSISDMLAQSPIDAAVEWIVHDYSGFGEARLNEYEHIENVNKIAEFIAEYGELGATLLGEYSVDDAQTLLEECYHGAYNSKVDFACIFFDECYNNDIPNNLIDYIDHAAFAHDLFINDYFSVEANGQIHVFSNF